MMRVFHAILTVTLGLALIGALAVSWRARRELNGLKQTQHQMTDANDVLRKTLGELTVAIAQKEKEIDRLHESSCKSSQKRNSTPPKVPRESVRTENSDAALASLAN
jgi:hypothetical protein